MTDDTLRKREDAVAIREADVQRREAALAERDLADALRKMDAVITRFDEWSHDPDDDELTSPPVQDQGELQSVKTASPGPLEKDEPENHDPELPRPPVAIEY
jgi:hypothetical protein